MSRARTLRRAFGLAAPATLAALATLAAPQLNAAPIDPTTTHDPPEGPTYDTSARLKLTGLPLVGTTVSIEAANLVVYRSGVPVIHNAPFEMGIVTRPSGSTASLDGTGTTRSLTLDRAGTYVVRLVVCDSGCKYGTSTVPALATELTITAKAELPVPTDVNPALPNLSSRATTPTSFPNEDSICRGGTLHGAAWTNPQWTVPTRFNGPSDYVLVEGTVLGSRSSSEDNPLNHDSQDWNIHVTPDAPYRHLLNAHGEEEEGEAAEEMELEWERAQLPEAFRPSDGDRISAFGYHILDCGHPSETFGDRHYRTEVHPPVLTAVHRPRNIVLPADVSFDLDRDGAPNEKVGKDVVIAGIQTDVWVNANGGATTNDCSATTLHQPPIYIPPPPGSPPSTPTIVKQDCIQGLANLKRTFTFNVYLPTSPQVLAKKMGMTNPKPAPLYFGVKAHPTRPGDSVIQPKIVPVVEGDVTYLRVTYDLTGYTGTRFGQQIVAGWMYPSADNWGAERVSVSVPSVYVAKDGDWFSDGDWRLFVGTKGATSEWARVFDCDGCTESDTTYKAGSSPFLSVGNDTLMSDGRFRGDTILLSHQQAFIAANGFEDDLLVGDDIGNLSRSLLRTNGSGSIKSSTGMYTLNWKVQNFGALTPTLSAASIQLANDYKFTSPSGGGSMNPPLTLAREYTPRAPKALPVDAVRLLANVQASALSAATAEAPADAVHASLTRLRTKIDAQLASNPKSKTRLLALLGPVRDAVPAALWNAHFADLAPKS